MGRWVSLFEFPFSVDLGKQGLVSCFTDEYQREEKDESCPLN